MKEPEAVIANESNVKFLPFFVVAVLGSAAVLAAAWPLAQTAAKNESTKLVGEAGSASAAEALVDYRLAARLDRTNQAAYLCLAQAQIAAGQPEAALTALERAGEGSEAAQLRLRTLLELGRNNEAAGRASPLAVAGRSDDDIVLAALAYAQAGRSAELPALMALVGSPEAAGRITRAEAGKVPLAAELLASGLPESSRALLMKQPTSFERNILLAKIFYTRHTKADLKTASDYLEDAVTLNPADEPAHKLLASVYAERGMSAESSVQTALAAKLAAGKP